MPTEFNDPRVLAAHMLDSINGCFELIAKRLSKIYKTLKAILLKLISCTNKSCICHTAVSHSRDNMQLNDKPFISHSFSTVATKLALCLEAFLHFFSYNPSCPKIV